MEIKRESLSMVSATYQSYDMPSAYTIMDPLH